MPQQVRTRFQKTINFSENGRSNEQLGRGMIYREIMLRLQGSIDVGADGEAPAEIRPGEEWGIVKKIELTANGTDVIRNITGEELRWHNYFIYGVPPAISEAWLGAAADATVAFDSTLVIPMWSIGTRRPVDTMLDARQLSSLELEITWGTATDITNGGIGLQIVAAPSVEVYSLESFGVEGPFAQSRIFRIEESSVPVTNQFQIELPVGPMYRGFLIHCQDDSGNDLVEALNNIKIFSGTTVFYDAAGEVVQQWTYLRKGIQQLLPNGTALQNPFVSANSNRNGWYFVELVTDGLLSEAIDTLGFSELKMEFDVASAIDTLTVLPLEIVPVRKKNVGQNGG